MLYVLLLYLFLCIPISFTPPNLGYICLELYALLESKQGIWRVSFKLRVKFIDKLIQLTKGANDRIIIQGKLVWSKGLCMHNHGLHHVLIYAFHFKIQRLMQRLLLKASRSLTE